MPKRRNDQPDDSDNDNDIIVKMTEKDVKNIKKKSKGKEDSQLLEDFINSTLLMNKNNDIICFLNHSNKDKKIIIEKLKQINLYHSKRKSKIIQLIDMDIPIKYKNIVLNKIVSLTSNYDSKLEGWIDKFFKIPFKTFSQIPYTIDDGNSKCNEFISECRKTLDDCVYGMNDVKETIIQIICKWIANPSSMGTSIALKGPMGTGKTSIVKKGISKLLNRPFSMIALGGAYDSSYLIGHSYTYEGSNPGKIIDVLVQSKCLNPIIFFDELDKVSKGEKGNEIIGVLTHLTDTTQNSSFQDKYFSEFDFDLSKCLFIFSYNNEEDINPILLDRMTKIEVKGYTKQDKLNIVKYYFIPEIQNEYNLKEISLTDELISYITDNTNKEEGVRNLRRNIEIIYSHLNMERLLNETIIEPTIENISKYIHKSKENPIYHSMYL
jgi:ATP-dependent Lon protease